MWWIAQTACVSALLAAFVAIAGRVARLSPAVKHALWLLVLVKLITPPVTSYRLPFAADVKFATWISGAGPVSQQGGRDNSYASSIMANPSNRQLLDAQTIDLSALADAEPADVALLADSPRFADVPAREAADPESNGSDVAGIQPIIARLSHGGVWLLLSIWALGALPYTVIQAIRIVRLRRFLKRSLPAPVWLDRLVREVAGTLNIRPPQIVVSPALCSPLVCALGKPKLVWPSALTAQLPEKSREAVVLHELAHLRRRDHWVAWLQLAAGVLWWFNPLYWYVCHQLRENAELACDAWVIGVLPSSRRAYALALIDVTEFVSFSPAAAPVVALGNVARRTLERRLIMIMRDRSTYRVPLLGTALIGLSLLAVLPGWSGGQTPVEQGSSPDSSAAQAEPANVRRNLNELDQPGSDAAVALPNDPVGQPGNLLGPQAPPTKSNEPAPAGFAVTAANNSGDDRISQLEAKLTQLLAEVQAVRRAGSGGPSRDPVAVGLPGKMGASDTVELQNVRAPQYAGYPRTAVNHRSARGDWMRFPQGDVGVEALTRARYKLTDATASALATFIKEHARTEVETKVDGDTLTVIASADDQAKIGAFVDLLHDQPRAHGRGGHADGDKKSTSPQDPKNARPGTISDTPGQKPH